ncbi:hypothetical protein [Bradyrhizobium lablabi]|nr:hypothetical protein [Bradyrhizobium lablabi]
MTLRGAVKALRIQSCAICDTVDAVILPLTSSNGTIEGGAFSWSGAGLLRASMLLCFFGLFFLSLAMVSTHSVAFHVRYHDAFSASAATALLLTACIAPAFQFAKFSFGYFVSFYLFTMTAGYFWLNRFSELEYDHRTALISAIVSIILFLVPALLIRPQTNRATTIPLKTFNHLPACILVFAIFTLAISSLSGFHFVGLSEMYKYRTELAHPRAVQYLLGNISGALIPFAFACLLAKRRWLMLFALFSVSAMYYAVTLTKVSLFLPFYLVFIALLSMMFEAKISAVLSLLIPLLVGLFAMIFLPDVSGQTFGLFSLRLLAIPSISLEHYNAFFANHPLTHFCQISIVKRFVACPYSDQLGVVFANEYKLGNMNASLFATEGVASVGPVFAPLSALVCGLVIAVGNKASAGLPDRFVLISASVIPQILLNVPLSTTLLSNGLGLLFLLWHVTPRSYFDKTARCSHELTRGPDREGRR